MRNPPAAEIFNEEVANLLKRKIKATVTRLDDLSIAFDYEGEVTAQDAAGDPRPRSRRSTAGRCEAAEVERSPSPCRGAAAVRRQPAEGVLRLRARLLPAEPAADRGRRDQRDQGVDRAVADPGGDLLLPETSQGSPARQGPESGEMSRGVNVTPLVPIPQGISFMRIAQVAPLYESVPPKLYGGTERVVSWSDGRAGRAGSRGHAVRQR